MGTGIFSSHLKGLSETGKMGENLILEISRIERKNNRENLQR